MTYLKSQLCPLHSCTHPRTRDLSYNPLPQEEPARTSPMHSTCCLGMNIFCLFMKHTEGQIMESRHQKEPQFQSCNDIGSAPRNRRKRLERRTFYDKTMLLSEVLKVHIESTYGQDWRKNLAFLFRKTALGLGE